MFAEFGSGTECIVIAFNLDQFTSKRIKFVSRFRQDEKEICRHKNGTFGFTENVIFLCGNILMNCIHLLLIGYLLMLTYFLCGKCSRISVLLLIIY